MSGISINQGYSKNDLTFPESISLLKNCVKVVNNDFSLKQLSIYGCKVDFGDRYESVGNQTKFVDYVLGDKSLVDFLDEWLGTYPSIKVSHDYYANFVVWMDNAPFTINFDIHSKKRKNTHSVSYYLFVDEEYHNKIEADSDLINQLDNALLINKKDFYRNLFEKIRSTE